MVDSYCLSYIRYFILLVDSLLDNVQDEFDVQVTVHRDKFL